MKRLWLDLGVNSRLLSVPGVPGVLGEGASVSAQLYAYLATLGTWTLDLRFDEASGNLINYGTDGNSGTVTGATQDQAGQLGTSEAYSFDGVDDVVTFANAVLTGTKAAAPHRWLFLANATGLGELNQGNFAKWGDIASILRFTAGSGYFARIDTSSGAFTVASADATAVLNEFVLVFVDFDDTDALGDGRKIRIILATSSSPAAVVATSAAVTGTLLDKADDLIIANNASTTESLPGSVDAILRGVGLWSPNSAPANLTRCDAIRSIVFGV